MPDLSSPYLDTWKDWEPEVFIERKDAATGDWEPADGLTGVEFRIAATEQGAAIGTLTGIAATERGDTGRYAGSVDLATLTSQLPAATYPHLSYVYLQVYKANDVQVEAFRKQIRRMKYG